MGVLVMLPNQICRHPGNPGVSLPGIDGVVANRPTEVINAKPCEYVLLALRAGPGHQVLILVIFLESRLAVEPVGRCRPELNSAMVKLVNHLP